jgi:hypothetical protein
MSGASVRIALMALATGLAVTAFLITSVGPSLSMSKSSPALQSGLDQAAVRMGVEQGYTILAGTTVRDHRSGSKSNVWAPQGGVSVSDKGKPRPQPGTTACLVNPLTGTYYCKNF